MKIEETHETGGVRMRNRREGILVYDTANNGYDIRFDLEVYYGGLYCGSCFEVRVKGQWIPVRMELDLPERWYLVGLPHIELNGLQVRI